MPTLYDIYPFSEQPFDEYRGSYEPCTPEDRAEFADAVESVHETFELFNTAEYEGRSNYTRYVLLTRPEGALRVGKGILKMAGIQESEFEEWFDEPLGDDKYPELPVSTSVSFDIFKEPNDPSVMHSGELWVPYALPQARSIVRAASSGVEKPRAKYAYYFTNDVLRDFGVMNLRESGPESLIDSLVELRADEVPNRIVCAYGPDGELILSDDLAHTTELIEELKAAGEWHNFVKDEPSSEGYPDIKASRKTMQIITKILRSFLSTR